VSSGARVRVARAPLLPAGRRCPDRARRCVWLLVLNED
jgi:hypothetical protein